MHLRWTALLDDTYIRYVFQDKCFICQLEIDIDSLNYGRAMSCCRKFLHKRCFKNDNEHSFMCGHCRRVHDYDSDATTDTELGAHESLEDSPIWRPVLEIAGPTITELVRNAIADLSSTAFARSLHQPGTRSWERPTYNINPTVCFDRFISR